MEWPLLDVIDARRCRMLEQAKDELRAMFGRPLPVAGWRAKHLPEIGAGAVREMEYLLLRVSCGRPIEGAAVRNHLRRSTKMAMTCSENPVEGATIIGVPDNAGAGAGPGPEIMAASTLAGNDVVNPQGQALGKIKEIMLDVPGGWIAYAVLSSGGLLGIGDRLFAIPWGALALDINRKCFILDVDIERLKQAPGFDKDHWPSMADLRWANEVHAYCGQRAYWQAQDNQTQRQWPEA